MDRQNTTQTLIIPPFAMLTEASYARVEVRAVPCNRCEHHEWRLSKWQRGKGWSVDIQCVECGVSGGQPFPKNEHPQWESYPVFDKTHSDRWGAERVEAYLQQREEKRALMSADYAQWRATSPEWADMRKRVMARANKRCEACLDHSATEVHHLTYDFGWLPPAYLLVAICRTCHSRMSAPGDA